MKPSTQMPRGLLRSSDARIRKLESLSMGSIVLHGLVRMAAATLYTAHIMLTDRFRKKNWWEDIHH